RAGCGPSPCSTMTSTWSAPLEKKSRGGRPGCRPAPFPLSAEPFRRVRAPRTAGAGGKLPRLGEQVRRVKLPLNSTCRTTAELTDEVEKARRVSACPAAGVLTPPEPVLRSYGLISASASRRKSCTISQSRHLQPGGAKRLVFPGPGCVLSAIH